MKILIELKDDRDADILKHLEDKKEEGYTVVGYIRSLIRKQQTKTV